MMMAFKSTDIKTAALLPTDSEREQQVRFIVCGSLQCLIGGAGAKTTSNKIRRPTAHILENFKRLKAAVHRYELLIGYTSSLNIPVLFDVSYQSLRDNSFDTE
jgi:hypothetical protein